MLRARPIDSLSIERSAFNELIREFDRDINSKRIMSRIVYLYELINVLWKRNVLSRNSCPIVLRRILIRFPNPNDQEKIKNYINLLDRNDNFSGTENFYAKMRLCNQLSTSQNDQNRLIQTSPIRLVDRDLISQTSTPSYQVFLKKKSKIYELIASEVEKWRDFGRQLEFNERELCSLEQTLRNDIKSITHQILNEAEVKFKDRIALKLCDALEKIRRKDISKQVRKMLENPGGY